MLGWTTKIKAKSLLWICLGCMPSSLLFAESVTLASDPHDPLFAGHEPLSLTLRGPFEALDKKRDKTADYAAGTLTFEGPDGVVSIDTQYQPRGNFRLQKENCRHAQLWVDLKKKHTSDTLFANQNKLKLVVQCRDSKRYEGYLRKEFQAYRMLNQLTPASHRVRWVNVTYESLEGEVLRTQSAFFIEHKKRLANRLGLNTVDDQRISKNELDPHQATLVSLFNYFIGNADYSLVMSTEGSCCHNAKLFQAEENTPYVPVIYDFDSSGYVNPPYAITPEKLKLRSVKQRVYRGFCTEPEIFESALALFQTERETLLALAGETAFVGKSMSRKGVSYLEDFYDVIDNPKKVERKLLEACR